MVRILFWIASHTNTITLGGILSFQILARELVVDALLDNAKKAETEKLPSLDALQILQSCPSSGIYTVNSTILSFLWNINIIGEIEERNNLVPVMPPHISQNEATPFEA